MSILVIVAYKPKPGREKELEILVKSHVDKLKKLDLATNRKPVIGRAADGSLVEIFEWKSKEAIAAAHEHPEVQRMWREFEEVCEYLPIGDVKGASDLFTELTAVS
ncbi:MAG: hypothetical protein ACNS60_20820 [Candidatus Cyclobacteriaceae bacterium M2_1C_046]